MDDKGASLEVLSVEYSHGGVSDRRVGEGDKTVAPGPSVPSHNNLSGGGDESSSGEELEKLIVSALPLQVSNKQFTHLSRAEGKGVC